MEIKVNIDSLELIKTVIKCSALVSDKDSEKYLNHAYEALLELQMFFMDNHEKFSDLHFNILRRVLGAMNYYDLPEEYKIPSTYINRSSKLNYKTLDYFDGKGHLMEIKND
jgi:hypothetical protein